MIFIILTLQGLASWPVSRLPDKYKNPQRFIFNGLNPAMAGGNR